MSVFSLEGKVLKLNNEKDVESYVEELNKYENLEEVRLSGNTLGVEAGKALAKALKKHSGLKRAILSDMFTGRLKTEIPPVLEAFVEALEDKKNLVELDLSDNAFGPAGAGPLQRLIINNRNIQKLYLNNNGLGIGGGKLIAEALTKCAEKCREEDKKEPVLNTVVCGRNRLESEGSSYLAKAFENFPYLMTLKMPQNSIRPEGIATLVSSLSKCTKLVVLDVQDNTFTEPGCKALVSALDSWPDLKELNIGESLLGASGGKAIIEKLTDGFEQLEKLYLSFNEIDEKGATLIPTMLMNKKNLSLLELNGNAFDPDSQVVENIQSILRGHGHPDALDELDEMELPSEDEESEEDEGDDVDNDDVDEKEEAKMGELADILGKTKLTA